MDDNNKTVVEGEIEIKEKQKVFHLEDNFPLHDRRVEGYKLIGFVGGKNKPKNKSVIRGEYFNPHYPYGDVPVWMFLGHDIGKKYTGAMLRQLRAERGVGNVKKIKRNAEQTA